MFSTHPSARQAASQSSNVIDVAARWLSDQDDLALGCECADPTLQIERWQQEAPQLSSVGD